MSALTTAIDRSAVTALLGQRVYEPSGLGLTWAPNREADLAGYRV